MWRKLRLWYWGKIYSGQSYGFITKTGARMFSNEVRRRGLVPTLTVYKDVAWGIWGTFSEIGAKYWVGVDKAEKTKSGNASRNE